MRIREAHLCILILTVALVVLLMSGLVQAAGGGDIVSVTAIAETLPEGQKVTAVAIEYLEPIAAEAVSMSVFSVAGRSITRCYVNSSGDKGDVKPEGNYVILELGIDPTPGSPVGGTLLYANGLNERLPIHLSIVQKADITTLAGNTILPGGFTNTAERNLGVDGVFEAHSYTNPVDGTVLNYRLFVPKNHVGEPLPLVVFLHGAGEKGKNNIVQLLANPSALEWTTDAAQAKNPCIVLAPQCPPDTSWAINVGTEEMPVYESSVALRNVKLLVDQLVTEHSIDTARIYGTGLSMGSMGTLMMALENPTLHAALLTICGASVYPDEQVAGIVEKPIWAIIASDDMPRLVEGVRTLIPQLERLGGTVSRSVGDGAWNGFLRGEAANAQALAQIADAKAKNANILYSEYIAGTVIPSGHWSWMAAYSTDAIREWVFSQRADEPYQPE